MALIDKRFVHFKTRAAFNTAKTAGDIDSDSVVFIKDEKRIWTHDEFFTPASFSKVIDKNGNGFEANDIYQAISFLSGAGLEVTVSNDGKVTYSHTDTSNVANVTAVSGKFINSITFDEFGHVIGVTTADVDQNSYKNIVAGGAEAVKGTEAAVSNGNVHINIVEHDAIANTDVVSSSINIKGKNDIEVTATDKGVVEIGHILGAGSNMVPTSGSEPGGDSIQVLTSASVDPHGHLLALGSLPVPTKAYVDSKVSNLSGALDTSLLFRGVIGTGTNMIKWEDANQVVSITKDETTGEETRKGSELGDIYKIGSAGTYADQVCQVGDLIICTQSDPLEWVVVQGNADVATEAILGFVKGGYTTNENARNFAVQIAADGTMWVNVPFEYTNTSESVVTNSAISQGAASAENGSVFINHLETSKAADKTTTTVVKSSVNIKGNDATKVTADANGVITVDSHDTKYNLSKEEKAGYKTFSLLQDGTAIATFKFDEWHEGD